MTNATEPRLTGLAHGGGCGCKLSPGVLAALLARLPAGPVPAELLVGLETGDDAAVWRLNDAQAVVATTDFFTPIVDDPHDFGRIAATNALSDVYAMGATPLFALALLGMPLGTLPVATAARILAGGASVCAAAGIPVVGGHSIDSPEPIYGLVALGLVHPDRILRNRGARPGDALVLTKALGIGVYGAALKKNALPPALYEAMVASATQLNTPGPLLAADPAVHAATDVTGFGLLGHALEMARASGCGVAIDRAAVPRLPEVERLLAAGFRPGATGRNWDSYGAEVSLAGEADRALLCDPQTSGGLLVAVAPEAAGRVVGALHGAGFAAATVVGRVVAGAPRVAIEGGRSA